jgi:hypothetical protein
MWQSALIYPILLRFAAQDGPLSSASREKTVRYRLGFCLGMGTS